LKAINTAASPVRAAWESADNGVDQLFLKTTKDPRLLWSECLGGENQTNQMLEIHGPRIAAVYCRQ